MARSNKHPLEYMQNLRLIWLCCFWIAGVEALRGQGFINLDFETTEITAVHFPGGDRYLATVPGWGPLYNFIDPEVQDAVALNDIALDSPAVTLQGRDSSFFSPLQGSYSLLLQGGSDFFKDHTGQGIGQTGQIPSDAHTLTWWAEGLPLQVAFDGQPIPAVAFRDSGKYVIYVADISEHAGETGVLTFARPWSGGNWSSGTVLDNIHFWASQVPEPGSAWLVAVGAGLLFRRWKTRSGTRRRAEAL